MSPTIVILRHDTRSRRRPSAAERGRDGAFRSRDQRAFSSSSQLLSVEPTPWIGVKVAGPRRVPRESDSTAETREEERRRSIRTQLHARTASDGRGEEKRRDKRERGIEAQLGDWLSQRDGERETETARTNSFLRSGLIPRASLLRTSSRRSSPRNLSPSFSSSAVVLADGRK